MISSHKLYYAAIALTAVGVALAGGSSGYALFPFDYVATYSFSGSSLSFTAEGTLTAAPVCDGSWTTVNESYSPTMSSAKKQKVKVSTVAFRYVLEDQANFVLHSMERVCLGTAVNTNVGTSCAYDNLWGPVSPPGSLRDLPEGWSAEGQGTGNRRATGAPIEVEVPADLRIKKLRIDYAVSGPETSLPGPIPFTGRMHFFEADHVDDIYSEDYIAGYCVGADASPEGCCYYTPTFHDVVLSARATTYGAPPLGDWEQHLMACNTQCA